MGEELHDDIIAHLPYLRTVALILTRDRTFANDLVQDAVLLSLSHADQFQSGSNFKAWIGTILRNSYVNEIRRRSRTSPVDVDDDHHTITVNGGQEEHLYMLEVEKAFQTLVPAHREALALVGAKGFSHEEAATMARCAIGTMKSRVSRARSQLRRMLEGGAQDAGDAAPAPRNAAARMQHRAAANRYPMPE